MKLKNSVVIHQNKSIKVILSGLTRPSTNVKTGDMLQVSILAAATDPVQAKRLGLDTANCGNCAIKRECYVNIGQMPLQIYRATYNMQPMWPVPLPPDKPIRLGAYGDPAFIPLNILHVLTHKRRYTGYTHQWRHIDRKYSRYLMASIDKLSGNIEQQIQDCTALGYRYFRISDKNQDLRKNEIVCPYYSHGVQCAQCGLCNGSGKAKNITVAVHGSGSKSYQNTIPK